MSGDPFFLPWEGARYRDGIGGVRLLLVGDSHYSPDQGTQVQIFTRELVRDIMEGKRREPFFSKIATLVAASAGIPESPFWDSVAFYNFVQVLAGATPEDAPTDAMYREAVAPFWQVLQDLQPDAVIVFCQRTWNHIKHPEGATSVATIGGDAIRRWAYPSGLNLTATWTNHPTGTRGFKPGDWQPRLEQFFQIARASLKPT
jgi:hypothetical protein